MLYLVGAENTPEYAAARDLGAMIGQAWPTVVESPADQIHLVAGAKCHGQQTRDIDVLLLARFAPGTRYAPFLSITGHNKQPIKPEYVQVHSLCLVVEVKELPPEAVRFVGTAAEVRYGGHWKSASEQNERQLYAVQHYLRQHGIQSPWITPLIWLRNVPNTSLPRRPHNLLGAELTWDLLLNVVGQTTPVHWIAGTWALDAARQSPLDLERAVEIFTQVLTPTRLDRARMERLNHRSADLAPFQGIMDRKLAILRGRGGTGKTLRLLQLAKHLLDEQNARVLILTYNKALVADIRRLLTILGIGDDITSGAIQIQTVHSFLHAALHGLDLITSDYATFLVDYERLKDEALTYLRSGAVSPADVATQATLRAEPFTWDYVFVDEGQDWPNNERDLLLQLYPYHKVAVADGVDQLIRRSEPTNWRAGVGIDESTVIPLHKTLRMKAGLARFVSAVAGHLGLLGMEWEANVELPGGQVIIVDGPYLYDRRLHDRLLAQNTTDGNSPVDMLFCVPPSLVAHGSGEAQAQSVAAVVFQQWGLNIWDGAAETVRESYPTDLNQLRIVQYESCRGLEGWVVVNLALDRFYEYKLLEGSAVLQRADDGTPAPGVFSGDPLAAQQYAARWMLIPLTRAMDTLVIQLEGLESPLRAALKAAAQEYREYVTWLRMDANSAPDRSASPRKTH